MAWRVSPRIGLRGFRKVFVQKNEDKVAVITSLNLSKKSGVIVAFVMYNGKTEVPWTDVSKAVLGIMTLIGKLTLVRFKDPDNIFFPIYLTISFPTLLAFVTTFLSAQILPPFSYPSGWRMSSSFGKYLKLSTNYRISSLGMSWYPTYSNLSGSAIPSFSLSYSCTWAIGSKPLASNSLSSFVTTYVSSSTKSLSSFSSC